MNKVLGIFILFFGLAVAHANTLTIEENQDGLCNFDGIIENSQPGFTSIGYINIDGGSGTSINYSIETTSDSICSLSWRYAIGGGNETPRDGLLILNDTLVIDTVKFPFTGSWSKWHYTNAVSIELPTGKHKIRLSAIPSSGLANIDHLLVIGSGVQSASCKHSYTFAIDQNIDQGGEVWFEPELMVYEEGTEITVHALANEAYFFHSWRGYESSAESEYTFNISGNTIAKAMFYPMGVKGIDSLIGYACVQHDNGTPFLLNGGIQGSTVLANTVGELKEYLLSEKPYVVQVNKMFESNDVLNIKSNKTLIGITDDAYLKGIRLEINGAENVIVQNLKISHVERWDLIEINGGSRNICLNHLDLFNDRDHGTDFYDGILDIKNESSFITVSWCKIHDHYKTILMASGDQAAYDTVARVTFHHNYFYNCGSRLPSIRFGKAHVFNNYYENNKTAINSRMGACVRVENNYFEGSGTAVMMRYSDEKGAVELIKNHFEDCGYVEMPACELQVPYEYEKWLDVTEDVPEIVAGKYLSAMWQIKTINDIKVFPNPATLKVGIAVNEYNMKKLEIYNTAGMLMCTQKFVGKHTKNSIEIDISTWKKGIYFIKVTSVNNQLFKKFIIN